MIREIKGSSPLPPGGAVRKKEGVWGVLHHKELITGS